MSSGGAPAASDAPTNVAPIASSRATSSGSKPSGKPTATTTSATTPYPGKKCLSPIKDEPCLYIR
ncbi:MAG: hypothetical protein U0165_10065 [Polyangiaceae bacterium]